MPLDPFFTSGWKRKGPQVAKIVAAKHRRSWPVGSQFTRQVGLEMRGGGREWWHFLSVPEERVETELELWREGNPGFEFRVKEPVSS